MLQCEVELHRRRLQILLQEGGSLAKVADETQRSTPVMNLPSTCRQAWLCNHDLADGDVEPSTRWTAAFRVGRRYWRAADWRAEMTRAGRRTRGTETAEMESILRRSPSLQSTWT